MNQCQLLFVSASVLVQFAYCFISSAQGTLKSPTILEDARLNFTELARKYGSQVQEHHVVTADGYILTLFHVLPNKYALNAPPILLMHGIADCSDNFIIKGKSSITLTLALEGYDVWAANGRGNKYTRSHIFLDPEKDKMAFWNFSAHEHGVYDLPASVDYVLQQTGHKRLNAIAHSQGTTDFFILSSERPDYNDKINLMIALAPIAFLHDLGSEVKKLIDAAPLLNDFFLKTGLEELADENTRGLIEIICSQGQLSYDVCIRGVLFPFGGEDMEELAPSFVPVVFGHYPQPMSRKSLVHLAQIATQRRFMKFDYGESGNKITYNSVVAPNYNLSRVQMKIALLYSSNDGLSSVRNVAKLRRLLPNVVEYRKIKREKWNHLDYVWAEHVAKYLYPMILEVLQKYSY